MEGTAEKLSGSLSNASKSPQTSLSDPKRNLEKSACDTVLGNPFGYRASFWRPLALFWASIDSKNNLESESVRLQLWKIGKFQIATLKNRKVSDGNFEKSGFRLQLNLILIVTKNDVLDHCSAVPKWFHRSKWLGRSRSIYNSETFKFPLRRLTGSKHRFLTEYSARKDCKLRSMGDSYSDDHLHSQNWVDR